MLGTARAAALLGLSGAALARVIGTSEATVSRVARGKRGLDPSSKEGDLAALLVRLYRSLDALVGNDDASRRAWMGSCNDALNDYAACQALAAQARQRGVQWLRHWSVRHPPGFCGAVLDASCLALLEPTHRPTWVCKVTARSALMVHDERRELSFAA